MASEETPRCEGCGMLLLDPDEHGAGNPENPRCRICTRPDGTPLSYEEAVLAHAGYLRAKAGAPPEDAERVAREVLEGNPAWERD